jgi:hypothetical protein
LIHINRSPIAAVGRSTSFAISLLNPSEHLADPHRRKAHCSNLFGMANAFFQLIWGNTARRRLS